MAQNPYPRRSSPGKSCLVFLVLIAAGVLMVYRALHQGQWDQEQLLDTAIHKHNLTQVQSALAKGADPNSTSYMSNDTRRAVTYRHPPYLFVAVEEHNADIVSALIDHGANIHAAYKGQSVLEWALGYTTEPAQADVIKVLIKRGADPNAPLTVGGPPLFGEVGMGEDPIVAAFLDSGANPNVRDSTGEAWYYWTKRYPSQMDSLPSGSPTGATPLMVAAKEHRVDIARLLIQHSADVNAAMSDGTTALSLSQNDPNIRQMLLDAGAKS